MIFLPRPALLELAPKGCDRDFESRRPTPLVRAQGAALLMVTRAYGQEHS